MAFLCAGAIGIHINSSQCIECIECIGSQ
ncbi:MAG: hypothetical protein EZS28_035148, partial [Streblomastix strix]